jgi:ABC-type sulfate transport system permease component
MTADTNSATASAATLRTIKVIAIAISVLMVVGILGLMVLAAGKDEDIAGIVASALFVTLVSGVVATVAAVLQKRAQKAQ